MKSKTLFPIILSFKLIALIFDSTLNLPIWNFALDVFIAMMIVEHKKLFLSSIVYNLGVLVTVFDRIISHTMIYYSVNPRFWFAYPLLCIIGITLTDFVWILLLRRLLKNKFKRLTVIAFA